MSQEHPALATSARKRRVQVSIVSAEFAHSRVTDSGDTDRKKVLGTVWCSANDSRIIIHLLHRDYNNYYLPLAVQRQRREVSIPVPAAC